MTNENSNWLDVVFENNSVKVDKQVFKEEMDKVIAETPSLLVKGFTKELIIERYWLNPDVSPLGRYVDNLARTAAETIWTATFNT
jgi:hypothetical protein